EARQAKEDDENLKALDQVTQDLDRLMKDQSDVQNNSEKAGEEANQKALDALKRAEEEQLDAYRSTRTENAQRMGANTQLPQEVMEQLEEKQKEAADAIQQAQEAMKDAPQSADARKANEALNKAQAKSN